MGHGASRSGDSGDSGGGAPPPSPSRLSRLRLRLRRHRSGHNAAAGPPQLKGIVAEDFAGIARIEIVGAEMGFKDRWLACLSIGERTYRTATSDQLSLMPSRLLDSA